MRCVCACGAFLIVACACGWPTGFFRFACDNLTYPAQAPERTLELGMAEAAQDALLRDGSHAKVSTLCYNVLAES